MKIGIEAQRIQRKKKHGMDIVALEYIRHLQQIDQENEYFIFVKPDEDKAAIRETENFKIVELEGGPYPVWEQIKLPKACRKYRLDLLHCTSNTAPLQPGVPLITTVHDIIYLEKMNWSQGTYYQRFGNLYRRWVVPKIMRNCQKIITVSEFEADNMRRRFPHFADRIEVVFNAAGDHFTLMDDRDLESFAQRHKLPDLFIFFIGNTDPKKNVPNTLKAYANYRKQSTDALPLVMPDLDRQYLDQVLKDIEEPGLIQNIQLTGYIPNTELPKLYNLATLFLYTSRRESFGIPVLEAFQCGVPVIGSNVTSIPEVAADAALLCDPEDPGAIALAISDVLNSDKLRFDLISSGLERAKNFSWTASAQKLLDLYKEVGS